MAQEAYELALGNMLEHLRLVAGAPVPQAERSQAQVERCVADLAAEIHDVSDGDDPFVAPLSEIEELVTFVFGLREASIALGRLQLLLPRRSDAGRMH